MLTYLTIINIAPERPVKPEFREAFIMFLIVVILADATMVLFDL